MSATGTGGYRISVDFIRCKGHGICAYILPENVALDEWGYPIVLEEAVRPDRLRPAKRAALLCPELAVRVEEIRERSGAAHR
ncbi:MAG: ferredoxin [Actinomycetota bacterium]